VISGQTPPQAPLEVLSVVVSADRSLTLTWASEPEANYTVQTSTDFAKWFNVTPAVISEGFATDWRDGEPGYSDALPPSATVAGKFYRILRNR